jgi:signal transduction histidine kinase
VVNRIRAGSWLSQSVYRFHDVSRGDVILGGSLSLLIMGMSSGVLRTGHPHGGAVAAVAALAMTLPVAWERRAPLAAAAAIAVGAAVNEFAIGPMVRCAAGLPAAFAIAFFVGSRCSGRGLAAGSACCAAAVTIQAFFDPRLDPRFLVGGLPVVAGFCLAGRLARSRSRLAAALGQRNSELRAQREETAQLAVAADRARVAEDLHGFLGDRIAGLAAVAAAGREMITADPAAARAAFGVVENGGRATLDKMREVVGTLRQDMLTEPQPALAQLGALLERATSADARLHIQGSARTLPAGVEVTGYRIVEHLLAALADAPQARIDVRVRFTPDALELHVAGPPSHRPDDAASFASARTRAALLGGTLRIQTREGRCDAHVRLPVTAGYA